MNARLFFYFFATFFASFGAGVSDGLKAEGWVRLVTMSLGAGFAAVVAYLDKTSGAPPDFQKVRRVAVTIVAAGALFFFSGCGTAAYYPNGGKAVQTYANAKGFHFKGGGIELSADELDHATPTKAATAGATSLVTAAGAAAAGLR